MKYNGICLIFNPQIAENASYNSKISQKSNANFVMGYALNLCKFHIYNVPYNHHMMCLRIAGIA